MAEMKIDIVYSSVNKKGSTLIYAVFLLLVFSFIGVTLVNMLSGQNISSAEELHSTKAFFLAESGLEIAMIKQQSGTYTLDNATITVVYTSVLDNSSYPPSRLVEITSTGQSHDMKRRVQAKYRVFE